MSDPEEVRVESRETDATLIFDSRGVRLRCSEGLSFAVRWGELERVSLQVVAGQYHVTTRLVLWARDAAWFGADHPTIELIQGVGDLVPSAWAVSLCVGDVPEPVVLEQTQRGLGFAGDLYSGQLEQVRQRR